MKFQKYSQRLVLLLAAFALILPMELGIRYLTIGLVILYVGVSNFIVLMIGQKQGNPPQKLMVFVERFGNSTGTIIYLTVSMLIPILLGFYIVYVGLNIDSIPMTEGIFYN